jgi:hypothetical protein
MVRHDVPGDGNCLFHSIILITKLIDFDFRRYPGLLLDSGRAVQYLRNITYAYAQTVQNKEPFANLDDLSATMADLPHVGQWTGSHYAYALCFRTLELHGRVGIISRGRIVERGTTGVFLVCTDGHFYVETVEDLPPPSMVMRRKIAAVIDRAPGRLGEYFKRLCDPLFYLNPVGAYRL